MLNQIEAMEQKPSSHKFPPSGFLLTLGPY